MLGIVGLTWRGPYVATKFALEGLSDVLRLEMADTPIKVILIQPGPIDTEIRRKARIGFEKWVDWENSPRVQQYRDGLLQRLYGEDGPPDRFELPPAAVTAKLIRALDSPTPRARYKVTTPTYIAEALRRSLPNRLLDRVLMRA